MRQVTARAEASHRCCATARFGASAAYLLNEADIAPSGRDSAALRPFLSAGTQKTLSLPKLGVHLISRAVMRLEAKPIGTMYTTRNESDIAELSLGCSGLRVVVETNPNGSEERLLVEYHFEAPGGFRFLDEGDLIRYWESKIFRHGYHLFEVLSGDWSEQEKQVPGMLSVTAAVDTFREWFICTTNGCVNVLSVNQPLVREFT